MTAASDQEKLVIIAGPTGVGKSSFALELAESINGEIVSVDSVQVYRGLDIGSAKPTAEEQRRVPHHLIDVVDPNEEYNAADYMNDAKKVITEVRSRGAVPIVVGGTNLYIRILTHGIFEAPPASSEIRKRHREIASVEGVEYLHAKLAEVDPATAARVHPNDVVRVSRGLEVFELTGKPLSAWHEEHAFRTAHYDAMILAFTRPRDELYDRINQRVDQMLQNGLLDEWRSLVAAGVNRDGSALSSLGYRHMKLYDAAQSDEDRAEAVRLMKRDTRRFAKQQLSWLRNDARTVWFQLPEDRDAARRTVFDFLGIIDV